MFYDFRMLDETGTVINYLRSTDFAMFTYTREHEAPYNPVWQQVAGPMTVIPDEFLNTPPYLMPTQVTFLYLRPGLGGRLVAIYHNQYDTDERVFKYIVDRYAIGYEFEPNPDIYTHNPLSVAVRETSSVAEVLSRLAWENGKTIRTFGNKITLDDAFMLAESNWLLSERSVEDTTLRLTFTNESEVVNVFKVEYPDITIRVRTA